MVLNQQLIRRILSEHMVIGEWYQVADLISLFERVYSDFTEGDIGVGAVIEMDGGGDDDVDDEVDDGK